MDTKQSTPIPLIQLCYVRLAIQHGAAAAAFATDILGLQRVTSDKEKFLFRSDERYHTLCLAEDAERSSIGVELASSDDLDRTADILEREGFEVRRASAEECSRRFVRDALILRDASGNEIDLVSRPAVSGRRYFPSRDAGITGLQCVGLRSRAIKDDLRLWTTILGATVSDWIGDITYLSIDRKHHRIALYPSDQAGLLYVCYGVESLDSIMQNHYFAQERQIRILHGPGHEAASGQIFLRLAGPEGHVFSYGHGLTDIDARHRPRQFAPAASSLCDWGSDCSDIPELQQAVI
jgi:2,3-dihydroxy-p-cumate/2,3-dihydroxybenzoate 3,4-dioxygenase